MSNCVNQDEFQYLVMCIGKSVLTSITEEDYDILVRLLEEIKEYPYKAKEVYNYIINEEIDNVEDGSILDTILETCSNMEHDEEEEDECNIFIANDDNAYSFHILKENLDSNKGIIRLPIEDSVEDWCKGKAITKDQYIFLRRMGITDVKWSINVDDEYITMSNNYKKLSSIVVMEDTTKNKCGKDLALMITGIGALSLLSSSRTFVKKI